MKKILKFEVELDENNLPENIQMVGHQLDKDEVNLKALMIAAWDAQKKETLRVDIWTKDMPVHDMFILYHQNMMGMATSLDKSTGEGKLAEALRDYCAFFAEKTKIIG
jgi:gliding motility-associated protein GldC|tara:strand:- start:6222 stop:6545 length:324 start_codon:yes stop_codon:yes gene_type:complete